jgi:hypothetical protein
MQSQISSFSAIPLLFRKRRQVARAAAEQYVGTDAEVEVSNGTEIEVKVAKQN